MQEESREGVPRGDSGRLRCGMTDPGWRTSCSIRTLAESSWLRRFSPAPGNTWFNCQYALGKKNLGGCSTLKLVWTHTKESGYCATGQWDYLGFYFIGYQCSFMGSSIRSRGSSKFLNGFCMAIGNKVWQRRLFDYTGCPSRFVCLINFRTIR